MSSNVVFLLEQTHLLNDPCTDPSQISVISNSISQFINGHSFDSLTHLFREINVFVTNSQNQPEMAETILRLKIILWQRVVSFHSLDQNQIRTIMEIVQQEWTLHHSSTWFSKKVSSHFSVILLKLSRTNAQFLAKILRDLLRVSNDPEKSLCVLFTLQSIAETVFSTESRHIHWTLSQRLQLQKTFLTEASSIFQFVFVVLTQTQHEDAICAAVDTLSSFLTYIPNAVLLNENLISILSQLTEKRKYRNEILMLFTEWIGMSHEDNERTFQVFVSVLNIIAPQIDALMRTAFVSLPDRDQKLVLGFISFISLYFQHHIHSILSSFPNSTPVHTIFKSAHMIILRASQWAHRFDDQIPRILLAYFKTILTLDAPTNNAFRSFIEEEFAEDCRNLLLKITPLHPSYGVKFDTETNQLQKSFSSKQEFDSYSHIILLLCHLNPNAMTTFLLKSIQATAQKLRIQPSVEYLNYLQAICNVIGSCPPLILEQIIQCFALVKDLFNHHATSNDLKMWYGACYLHLTRQKYVWQHFPSSIFVESVGLCHHILHNKADSLLHTMCCDSLLLIFENAPSKERLDQQCIQCVQSILQDSESTLTCLSMVATFEYFKCLGQALQLLPSQIQQHSLSVIMNGPHQMLRAVLSQVSQNVAKIIEPEKIRSLEYTLKAFSKTSSTCGAAVWAHEYEAIHQNLEALYNVTQSWIESMWTQHGEQVVKIATLRQALRIKVLIIQILEHAVESAQFSTIVALLDRVTGDFLNSPAPLKPYRLLNLLSVVMRRSNFLDQFAQILRAALPITARIVSQNDGEFNNLNMSVLTLLGSLVERRDILSLIAFQRDDNSFHHMISISLDSMDKQSSKIYVRAHKITLQLLAFVETASDFYTAFYEHYYNRILSDVARLINDGDHKEAFEEEVELLFRLLCTATRMNHTTEAGAILIKEFREWNDSLTNEIVQETIKRGVQSVNLLRDELKTILLLGAHWDSTDFER